MAQLTAWATPEAIEAQRTGSYARAFRCLVKKRQAIRVAAPFTAAIVAVADSWIYANGVLCHIQDRQLRVLDLHKSATEETVVDIRCLLEEAIAGSYDARKYKFSLLHYSNGIVSCLYTRFRPDVESYLVVFDITQRKIIPISRPLESTNKIFVRNDENFLYCGTHSEFGEDGYRRWVLNGYNIKKEEWFERKIYLFDMVGSDIGQSISFDIIDGYFYCLSNQTNFEIDEVDWTSYYHCFRFPVGQPGPEHIERSDKDRMWRRQHAEGPIDDRWSFLRLLKNDKDGRLQVLESRREWLDRKSFAQRTYYTSDLWFAEDSGYNPEDSDDDDDDEIYYALASSTMSMSNPNAGDTRPQRQFHTNWALPDSPEPPRIRDPYNTHIGDDASTALLFTLSKCFVRSYYASSQTFVDLVDNPHPYDPESPRLQLRAGSRQLRSFVEVPKLSPAYDDRLAHAERIEHLYKNKGANKIVFWPPACHEAGEVDADIDALDHLNKAVNPPSHVGSVKGMWDDRSFVYSTGNNPDGIQALVFLGFDPAVRLQDVRTWGKEEQVAYQEEPCSTDATDTCETLEGGADAAEIPDEDESGKSKAEPCAEEELISPTMTATFSEDSQATLVGEPKCNWMWKEPAMYRQIGVGFNNLPDFTTRREKKVAAKFQ